MHQYVAISNRNIVAFYKLNKNQNKKFKAYVCITLIQNYQFIHKIASFENDIISLEWNNDGYKLLILETYIGVPSDNIFKLSIWQPRHPNYILNDWCCTHILKESLPYSNINPDLHQDLHKYEPTSCIFTKWFNFTHQKIICDTANYGISKYDQKFVSYDYAPTIDFYDTYIDGFIFITSNGTINICIIEPSINESNLSKNFATNDCHQEEDNEKIIQVTYNNASNSQTTQQYYTLFKIIFKDYQNSYDIADISFNQDGSFRVALSSKHINSPVIFYDIRISKKFNNWDHKVKRINGFFPFLHSLNAAKSTNNAKNFKSRLIFLQNERIKSDYIMVLANSQNNSVIEIWKCSDSLRNVHKGFPTDKKLNPRKISSWELLSIYKPEMDNIKLASPLLVISTRVTDTDKAREISLNITVLICVVKSEKNSTRTNISTNNECEEVNTLLNSSVKADYELRVLEWKCLSGSSDINLNNNTNSNLTYFASSKNSLEVNSSSAGGPNKKNGVSFTVIKSQELFCTNSGNGVNEYKKLKLDLNENSIDITTNTLDEIKTDNHNIGLCLSPHKSLIVLSAPYTALSFIPHGTLRSDTILIRDILDLQKASRFQVIQCLLEMTLLDKLGPDDVFHSILDTEHSQSLGVYEYVWKFILALAQGFVNHQSPIVQNALRYRLIRLIFNLNNFLGNHIRDNKTCYAIGPKDNSLKHYSSLLSSKCKDVLQLLEMKDILCLGLSQTYKCISYSTILDFVQHGTPHLSDISSTRHHISSRFLGILSKTISRVFDVSSRILLPFAVLGLRDNFMNEGLIKEKEKKNILNFVDCYTQDNYSRLIDIFAKMGEIGDSRDPFASLFNPNHSSFGNINTQTIITTCCALSLIIKLLSETSLTLTIPNVQIVRLHNLLLELNRVMAEIKISEHNAYLTNKAIDDNLSPNVPSHTFAFALDDKFISGIFQKLGPYYKNELKRFYKEYTPNWAFSDTNNDSYSFLSLPISNSLATRRDSSSISKRKYFANEIFSIIDQQCEEYVDANDSDHFNERRCMSCACVTTIPFEILARKVAQEKSLSNIDRNHDKNEKIDNEDEEFDCYSAKGSLKQGKEGSSNWDGINYFGMKNCFCNNPWIGI